MRVRFGQFLRAIAIGSLAIATLMAGPDVQDMRGVFTGFIQEGENQVEIIRTEITDQRNRRFSGIVDAGGPHVIDGTVAASGNVNYQGESPDGRRLDGTATFREIDGGAGILQGTHRIRTSDGRFIIPCVLELRSFAGDGSVVPNPEGSYPATTGADESAIIAINAPRDPAHPQLFDGTLTITIDGMAYDFLLIGTIASDGRVVIIGHQETAGHLVLEGTVDPLTSQINAMADIELSDGSSRTFTLRPGPPSVPTPTPTPASTPTPSPTPSPTPTQLVAVAVAPSAVVENGAQNLVYTFTRSGNTSGALTVSYTVGGTATQGVDYTGPVAPQSIAFAAGQTTANLVVDPTGDSTVEPDETVVITPLPGPGFSVSAGASGQIVNDDSATTPSPTPTPGAPTPTPSPTPSLTPTPVPTPIVTIAVSPASVTEDGSANLVFTITRSNTSGTLSVPITVSGTATQGSDFILIQSGSAPFPAGVATRQITIDPTPDGQTEPNETVTLTLTPGSGYSLGNPSSATGTIVDIDTVYLRSGSVPDAVFENGANMSIWVQRVGTVGTITVNFTISGTATVGTDYELTNSSTGTVVIADGLTTGFLLINPTNDQLVEPDETVTITLQPGTGYVIESPASLTRTILNDDYCQPDILYYKFDGTGTSVPNLASSPPTGTATATINGGQTQGGGTGQFGGGLNGSGASSSTDFLQTNWRTNLSNTDWTISFFIRNTGTPTGTRYIFGDASASSFRAFYGGAAGANNIILRGGFNDVVATGAVGTTTSSVVHFVYDGATDDIRAYVNGVLVNTVPQTTVNIMATGFLKVGGYSTLTGLSNGAAMDEFRIYRRALTAAEISRTYNRSQLVPCNPT